MTDLLKARGAFDACCLVPLQGMLGVVHGLGEAVGQDRGVLDGLGRALGETMAVTIILSASGVVTFNLISQSNPSTIAANIALNFPESSGLAVNTLIASGLVLFGITLVVNMVARLIISKRNVQ